VNCPGFVPVSVMLVMLSVALPLLVRVTLLVALVVLTAWLPNAMFAGANPAPGTVPVPLKGKECGLPDALSVTENAAERAPEAAGVKVAPNVQLWVGVSVVVPVQVVPDIVKSAAFVPVIDTAVMFRFALPVFVSVALIAALVVPTFWFPNEMVVGLSVTAGAGALTPVPVSGTVCGLPVASSATLTLALSAPSAVGANCTPTAQFEPAFSTLAPSGHAVPVVGATRANCPGFVPVSVMLVMFIDARPVLLTVTLLVALEVLMV